MASSPLYLCSPSTNIPALVKATTSLWQEHFQIPFPNYGNTCSPQGFLHLSPSDSGFQSFSSMLPLQFLQESLPQSFPLPSISVLVCKTQFRLSDSLLHGKDILELTGHWSTRPLKSTLSIPALFSFSPLQLLCG